MHEYVYLFELDSVRKTDYEIEIGQNTIYDEIVGNGNIVVLTYNQLIDSRGFFSLFSDSQYFENIIALFENGSICISQFDDIKTIMQYLATTIEYEKNFIYSGWPLKSTQKRLLALIKRSLLYLDLSEINDYIQKAKAGTGYEKAIRDIFIEIVDGKPRDTNLSMKQCVTILEHLYFMLKIVFRLSPMHAIYIPPRETQSYGNYKLHNILEQVIEFDGKEDVLYDKTKVVIGRLINETSGSDNRSVLLHKLKDFEKEGICEREILQYSEAIINLCYNYACEISVCNVSKHYNFNELEENDNTQMPTFKADFFSRLKQTWDNKRDIDERFLLEESDEFNTFQKESITRKFARAVSVNKHAPKISEINYVCRYEDNVARRRRQYKISLFNKIARKLGISIICVLFACLIEVVFGFFQSLGDNAALPESWYFIIVKTFLFLLVTEGITTFISGKYEFIIPFSAAIDSILKLINDACHIMFQKSKTHLNLHPEIPYSYENFSTPTVIDFVKSPAMKQYIKMKEEWKDCQEFQYSSLYPLADTNNSDVVKDLIKQEELYNCHFGVVYKSPYNILCVDPIIGDSSYYPYERVIPSAKNGVVIVPAHKGKLLLLRQCRHAPRMEHLCFPRGYGEPLYPSKDNVMKELQEEIGATVMENSIIPLGKIYPDNGLISTFAEVFLAEIDCYANTKSEGIKDIIEVDEKDFRDMVASKLIDCGFTLSAYLLYQEYGQRQKALTLR